MTNIPRRVLLATLVIVVLTLAACRGKSPEQLAQEKENLANIGCSVQVARVFPGRDAPECWVDAPVAWHGAGYIEVDETGIPTSDPPGGSPETAAAAPAAEQPEAPPPWSLPPAVDTTRFGVNPNFKGVPRLLVAALGALIAIYGILDSRERKQLHDGIVAIVGAWLLIGASDSILMFTSTVLKIQDPRAVAWIVLIGVVVTVIAVAFTGRRDFTAIAVFFSLIAAQAFYHGHLGIVAGAFDIHPQAQLLKVTEAYAYWAADVTPALGLTLWIYRLLAAAAALFLLEVLQVRDIVKLLKRIPQNNGPNWAALAASILMVVGYVILRQFTDFHPYAVIGIVTAIGIVVANLGRRFGVFDTPDGAPGDVSFFSPYLPWDGVSLGNVAIFLGIALLGTA